VLPKWQGGNLAGQKRLPALRNADEIGITLSEEDQLDPEQSTSAIVVRHPQAKYFSVWDRNPRSIRPLGWIAWIRGY
jgi:hypothetical protein